jgi:hypothetical protein
VEALEPIVREEVRRGEARRLQREAEEQERRHPLPDNEHVWLTVGEAAQVLGL